MKTLEQKDMSTSEAAIAVANTPLFLIRKLRADLTVQEIHSEFKGDEILKALKIAVSKKPLTLSDLVRPYAYLVALSYSPNISYLERALKIDAPDYDWLHFITDALIKSYQPTMAETLDVFNQLVEPETSTDSVTPTSRIIY